MSLAVLRSYVTRLFEVDTIFKNVFTLKTDRVSLWETLKIRQVVGKEENGYLFRGQLKKKSPIVSINL